MQDVRERIKILVPLLAGAYLGFYVYGVVMTVFSPLEWVAATAVAIVCVIGLIAFAIARRHGIDPVAPDGKLGRAARAQREHRGF